MSGTYGPNCYNCVYEKESNPDWNPENCPECGRWYQDNSCSSSGAIFILLFLIVFVILLGVFTHC
ncbi:hypothetical protein ACFL23_03285 [Patescibacteria group bacterium]